MLYNNNVLYIYETDKNRDFLEKIRFNLNWICLFNYLIFDL